MTDSPSIFDDSLPEGTDVGSSQDASQPVAALLERAKDDVGAPFEPEALEMLRQLRAGDPAGWVRARRALGDAGVPLRDLQLCAEWHPAKNGSLEPHQVGRGSTRLVWWTCSKGPDHEWQASPNSRIRASAVEGCPFCAGRRVSITNSLATCAPDIAAQWHPSKNGDLKPTDVVAGSSKKAWWQCRHYPEHVWQTTIENRTSQNRGCPYCARRKATPETSLATTHPEIAAQWLGEKNGTLRPDQVLSGSFKRVWWQCPVDPEHEWRTRIHSRTRRKTGCPHCARQRRSPPVLPHESLAHLHPQLGAEWHPTKNGELTPGDVAPRSCRSVWWKCSKGPDHEWKAAVSSRAREGVGCPFCAGRRLSVTNSLATLFPELALELHPTKNGTLTADQITANSTRKVWWLCTRIPEHEWRTSPSMRTGPRQSGCKLCALMKVPPSRSLATLAPDIARQWHPTKNGRLVPTEIARRSTRRVWWRCRNGPDHEWQARPTDRTTTQCPFCAGRRPSVTNSLASLYPEIAKEWHPTKNGELTPEETVAASSGFAWWRCPRGHIWRGQVSERTVRGLVCPRCAG